MVDVSTMTRGKHFLIFLCLFGSLYYHVNGSNNDIFVIVNQVNDIDSPNCVVSSNNLCSLRGAWKHCQSYSSRCVVVLPENSILNHDIDQGPLYLDHDDSIEIEGNGSIIQANSSSSAIQYFDEFSFGSKSFVIDSISSQQYSFQVFADTTIVISLCESILSSSTGSSTIPSIPAAVKLTLYDQSFDEITSISAVGTNCAITQYVDITQTYSIVMKVDIPVSSMAVPDGELIVDTIQADAENKNAFKDTQSRFDSGIVSAQLPSNIHTVDIVTMNIQLHAFYSYQYTDSQFIRTTEFVHEYFIANLTLTDLTISSFGAVDVPLGGAIYINGKHTSTVKDDYSSIHINMNNITFANNIADICGAIALEYCCDSITLNNVTFMNNRAIGVGGSLYIYQQDTSTDSYITLSDITVMNSYAYLGSGGGISLSNTHNVTINNFISDSTMSSIYGGSLSIDTSSNIQLTSVITSNSLSDIGGSVYLNDITDLTLTNIDITNSLATDEGGGMYCFWCINPTMTSVMTSYTSAVNKGGAISMTRNAHLVMTDISLSHSMTTAGPGGGLYLLYCEYGKLSQLQFNDMTSTTYGGSISIDTSKYLQFDSIQSIATISTSGGVVYIDSSDTLLFENMTISNSTVTSNGGVFYTTASTHITIRNIDSKYTKARYGGVLSSSHSTNLFMSGMNINVCYGYQGGGWYIAYTSNIVLDNIVVTKASSYYYGGIMYITNSQYLTLNNLNIKHSNNGICIFDTSEVTLSSITITDSESRYAPEFISIQKYSIAITTEHVTISQIYCERVQTNLGCIRIVFYDYVTINDVKVIDNTGRDIGGLQVYNVNYLNISDVRIIRTQADGGLVSIDSCNHVLIDNVGIADSIAASVGYGIHMSSSSNVQITNVTISNTFGGTLQCYACESLLFDNVVITNSITSDVGTIQFEYVTDTTLTNIMITNSTALRGGGIYATKSTNIHIINSIIQQCHSSKEGGGIYLDFENYNVFLVNIMLTNNTAGTDGGGFYSKAKNNNVLWLPLESYQDMITYDRHSNGYYHETFYFPNAENILLIFDKSTIFDKNEYCCGSLTITSGSDFFSSASNSFPGVDIAALLFTVNEVIVDYNLYTKEINEMYNNVKFYLIPIYSSMKMSNIIQYNIAKNSGGGLMEAYLSDGMILLNTLVDSNQALKSGGGGIMFKTYSSKTFLIKSQFTRNTALNDKGGAMYMGSSQYAFLIDRCNFTDNQAVSGGGIFMSLDNGIGPSTSDADRIVISNCKIDNNIASLYGGGLHLEEQNYVELSKSSVVNNQALLGDGGGIGVGTLNTLSVLWTDISTNEATSGCGGGIALIATSNNFDVQHNLTIAYNKALGGGGICVRESTTMSIDGDLVLHGNYGREGGAVLMMSSSFWSSSPDTNIDMTNNIALHGSAMFLYDVTPSSSSSVGEMNIEDNLATEGTTIYWIKDNSMSQLPFTLSESDIAINNQVRYGQQIGTQPVLLNTISTYSVVDYGNQLASPIVINAVDAYDHIVGTSVGSTIKVDLSEAHCLETSRPYIIGQDVNYGVLPFSGTATFSALKGVCYPEGSLVLQFTMDTDPLKDISSNVVSNHSVVTSVILNYRSCVAGEYITDGACTVCPNGTYSLEFHPNSTCISCSDMDGVIGCYGNNVKLSSGYWRRHDTSDEVMTCILGEDSCPGGWAVGDNACAIGYIGPFCAECDDDYYMSDGQCLHCGSSSLNPGKIISIILLSAIFLVAIGLALIWFKHEHGADVDHYVPWKIEILFCWVKDKFDAITIKLKIIIATYQVVISAAEVLDVTLPQAYTRFTNALNFVNLNVLQLFPLGCKIDIGFIKKLLWNTLAPFGLLVIIGIAYLIERGILLHQYDDPNDRKSFGGTLRSRYLNYIFYLTYLILPSVTTTIFQLYVCKDADPSKEDNDNHDSFLVADVSISCQTEYYENWKIYGYFMILLYPIGISFFYWYCLNLYKDEIMNREVFKKEEHEEEVAEEQLAYDGERGPTYPVNSNGDNNTLVADHRVIPRLPLKHTAATSVHFKHKMSPTAVRLCFLWEAYKPEYWYWELIETARRIILTAVLSVCSTGSSEQNVLSILLAFIFIKIYGYFQPYAEYSNYQMAEVGQSQIFLTYFVIIIIQQGLMNKDWNTLLGGLLIVVNLSIILLGLYYQAIDYSKSNPDVINFMNYALVEVADVLSSKASQKVSDPASMINGEEFAHNETVLNEGLEDESAKKSSVEDDPIDAPDVCREVICNDTSI